jgi:signal transduction histidine kinase
MRALLFSFLFFCGIALLPVQVTAQNVNDSLLFYYNTIVKPSHPENLPQGLAFYTARKEAQMEQHDTLGAVESLRLLAIGYFKMGELYDSESVAVEALELIARHSRADTLSQARVGLYNQLGRTYSGLMDYGAARKVLSEALQQASNHTDSIIILNNLANTYNDQGLYPEALEYYSLVHHKALKAGDILQQAFTLDNLGDMLTELHAPGARDSLLKAMELRLQNGDMTGLYSSFKNLANFYHQNNDSSQAMAYARKAQDVAAQLNSPAYHYDALETLIRFHSDQNVLAYNRMTDSLELAERLAKNKNAFIKYNLNKERNKTAEQKLEKEQQARSKQLFQLITVFILILLVLSYFIFRYRYKKGKQAEIYKTESRISKKVHDELANDLFNVLAFAENRPLQQPTEKEKLLSALDQLYSKTRDISKDISQIPTDDGYPKALKELLAGYSSQKVNVIIQGLDTLPWKRISDLKKMACFRVLQELLVNMKKHSNASLVLLKFARIGKCVEISYTDNGKGIAAASQLDRGGLRIAENRIDAIMGKFTFDSSRNQGFKCTISFPI